MEKKRFSQTDIPARKKANRLATVVLGLFIGAFLVSLIPLGLAVLLPGERIERILRQLYWSIPFYICLGALLLMIGCGFLSAAFSSKTGKFSRRAGAGMLCLLFIGLSVFCLWCLVAAPLLDIPYLEDPLVLQLENVYFDRISSSEDNSDSFYLTGETAAGKGYRFEIPEEDYDKGMASWEDAYEKYDAHFDMLAQVKCLPHTRTLLVWEYWPVG